MECCTLRQEWDGTNLTYFLTRSDIYFMDTDGMTLDLKTLRHQHKTLNHTQFWNISHTSSHSYLSVFLQLEQSWANLHWSACLCAIRASSSSHTCENMKVPGKSRFMGLRSRRCLPEENCHRRKIARFPEFKLQNPAWEIIAINCSWVLNCLSCPSNDRWGLTNDSKFNLKPSNFVPSVQHLLYWLLMLSE